MNFTSFKTIIRDEVANRIEDGCEVRLKEVTKNNGIILTGLTVICDDSNISPSIYLDSYYDMYERGRMTIAQAVSDILDVYHKNRIDKSIDMRYFLDYKQIRNKIIYKLINTEKNKELLEDIPHIKFHDLSIVFQFLITEEKFGNATILIHNAHLKVWGISVDELYADACRNTPVLNKYELKNMKDVIKEFVPCEDEDDEMPIYVLSNKSRLQGAACILYPDLLKNVSSTMNSSLYIIPSSVHEVLLLPMDKADGAESIKSMVREVNDTQVDVEEILSFSVYFYDNSDNNIHML